eukprot:TRINITY_DN4057_c0_g1_i1.p1 TRINITY_DN4057_c0_g1~~TRINITY_DN4057_c0_g1_i1.p1  ORF type:complete len:318 (-),score=63.15 TRINITY_DN4057_c0_g1_i1:32-985(-)
MSGSPCGNKKLLCKFSKKASSSPNQSNNLYVKPLPLDLEEEELRALFSDYGEIEECKVLLNKSAGLRRKIGFVKYYSKDDALEAKQKLNGYLFDEDDPPLVVKFAETKNMKIERRQRSLANQSSAASRNAEAIFDAQKKQYSAVYSVSRPSLPYLVSDQFGNITCAPTFGYASPPNYASQPVLYPGSPPMYPNTGGYPEQMMHHPYPYEAMYYQPGSHYNPIAAGDPFIGGVGNATDSGNLFIFHLPQSVDENELQNMFQNFGYIYSVKIARDSEGNSKGYGFVNFSNSGEALKAIANMNGKKYKNKFLKVSLKKRV